ncbi:MAG: glycosyltransferase family 4 protein [Oligoflexales bacterium]
MKVAFVVARYGAEVNGGAELHCRMIAERLKNEWDIEILTSCALDYIHWSNHYTKGLCDVNGVKTRRFEVDYERPINTFNSFYNLLVSLHIFKHNEDIRLDTNEHLDHLFDRNNSFKHSLIPEILSSEVSKLINPLESIWMKLQGPYSSEMLAYIDEHKRDYDVFVFFSANYCSTYFGLQIVADRSILVPTMHREACISFNLFKDFFKLPKFILYNTVEEMQFAGREFPHSREIPHDFVGVGVNPRSERSNYENFGCRNFSIRGPYILYLGRIDQSKGCLDLCHYFVNFNKKIGGHLTLVFAGKKICELPNRDDVVHVGFVSDQEKIHLIQDSLVVCIPSLFESLSMVLLEAWSLNTPTLVNGNCDVLKGHNTRGSGGFYYYNESDFQRFLHLMLENPALRISLGHEGRKYVNENYRWATILEKYRNSAAKVVQGTNLDH